MLINSELHRTSMPAATSVVKSCEQAYSQFEADMDSVLDQFISAAQSSADFENSLDKIEEQIAAAKKLLASKSDLELNETIIIAEKTEEELAAAERCAQGAALAETQEDWGAEIEHAKGTLERMSATVRKMKIASEDSEPLEVRSALMAFRRDEKAFTQRLAKLRNALTSKRHSSFGRLKNARKRVAKIKSEVGVAFETLAKRRLRRKTTEAKQAITEFVRKSADCRIFIDAKHLTMVSGRRVERVPLTQSYRFALEELAPISKSFSRLGKNGTVLVGSIERTDKGPVLRIGERSVVGDSIIYREKSYAFEG